ncbi:hypothetical protein ONS95_011342 [Cadophora gregata]|uniref:uncharacterized protein n=1 Tax=Cadophora gregata TaxID=51156 RepID=UPI0026DCE326|nr:uncharacterized protein ONS95_011342 [Cadophora gregata]KAK0119917.1 hypothetical protein ONS95_011342 [Cadophora gregata]KAK0120950.1 hypothetical protein ONS96_011145 [Cadophora gregata f. sp. sojae]
MMYVPVEDEKPEGEVPCSPQSPHSIRFTGQMPENSFPSLEYDLASKKWRILIFWTLVILDSFAIPIILYFVLNYSTTLNKKQVYYIISFTLFGTLMLEYAQRAWRLWMKNSTCRVVNTKRLDVCFPIEVLQICSNYFQFDWLHWNLTLVLGVVVVEVGIATSLNEPLVRLLAMPLPSVFFTFGLEMLLVELMRSFHIRARFRVSSVPKGGMLRPALYTLIEDVVAVDGNGGTEYRERLNTRYETSPEFRRLMNNLTYFWMVPALLFDVAVSHLIFWRGINEDTAYVIGWSLPFAWASFWTIMTIYWVRIALDEEKQNWGKEGSQLIHSSI